MALLFTVLFVASGAFAYYFFGFGKPTSVRRAMLSVGSASFRVEIADTPMLRALGLSGRDGLQADEGMLFLFETAHFPGFWMKGMKFPIDIVWIRGDEVKGVAERVPPEPEKSVFNLTLYHPPVEVDRVLELPAGSVARFGIKAGDRVVFTP